MDDFSAPITDSLYIHLKGIAFMEVKEEGNVTEWQSDEMSSGRDERVKWTAPVNFIH